MEGSKEMDGDCIRHEAILDGPDIIMLLKMHGTIPQGIHGNGIGVDFVHDTQWGKMCVTWLEKKPGKLPPWKQEKP